MSRRFVFELEPVLEQRHRLERRKQQAVAVLETQRLGIEARLRELQEQIAGGRRDWRDALSGSASGGASVIGMDRVRFAANSSLHMVVRLQRAAIELSGVHQKLGVARRELLAAAVARKAVEMLRAKRLAEWKRVENKRENDELDDLAVMRGVGHGDLT